jgi:hypothetical protein
LLISRSWRWIFQDQGAGNFYCLVKITLHFHHVASSSGGEDAGSLCTRRKKGKRDKCCFSPLSTRALIPSKKDKSSWPNHFVKVLHINPITFAITFWHLRFGGDTYKHEKEYSVPLCVSILCVHWPVCSLFL